VKVLGIDHIAMAVKELDKAVETFKKILGIDPIKIEEVPEEKVRIAMFKVGDVYIELLQGIDPESPVTKFIEKRGEGIHHIALRIESAEKASEELRAMGLNVLYEKPKVVSGGERIINFVHTKSVHGVLLEVVERRVE